MGVKNKTKKHDIKNETLQGTNGHELGIWTMVTHIWYWTWSFYSARLRMCISNEVLDLFDIIQWYLNSYAFDTSCHISGENQQNRCLTETNKLHSELSDFVSNPWNAYLKWSSTVFWLTEEALLLLIVPISFQGASLVSLQSYSCLSLTLLLLQELDFKVAAVAF